MYRRATVLLLLGACSTYAGAAIVDPDASTDAGGPPGDGGDDVVDTGASDDKDAPADGPDGQIFADDFEKPGPACSDWQVNGGTALVTTSAAHGGAQSCRLCAPAGTFTVIQKVVAAHDSGTYTLLGYGRAESGPDGGLLRMGLFASGADGSPQFAANSTRLPTSGWTLFEVTGSTSTPTPTITATLDLLIPIDPVCVDLDDIALFYAP